MLKFILPTLSILLAIFVSFYLGGMVLNGSTATWSQKYLLNNSDQGLRALKAEENKLNLALANAQALKSRIAELEQAEQEITREDHEKLEKFIPDNSDNVGFVADVNTIANRNGMILKSARTNTSANTNSQSSGGDALGGNQIGETSLSLVVTGQYSSLLGFLSALADSLRVADARSLSFTVDDKNLNQYNIEIKTYWVK